MNCLLINPQLPLSFWSFRQTCRALGIKSVIPPLGLITVAALLPREWQMRLADLNTRKLTEEDWNWADLVLLSGMFPQREELLALIKEAKERGKIAVAGGPYVTSSPASVREAGADFVVIGEGENTVPRLVSALRQGKKQGTFASDEYPDLSQSPVPRFDLLDFKHYASMSIQASRGCPFDCEFCDIATVYGRSPRYKAPNQVIGELDSLFRLGWQGEVFISDDNFIGNKKRARAILAEMIPWLKQRGEPFVFWTEASMNLGQDPEMIDLMTEANFGQVFIGIESPDEEVLDFTRKRHNLRNPLVDSIAAMNKNGLSLLGSFIIGFDGEKKGVGDRICALVEETAIPVVMINPLQAPPNTSLWNRLKREGRLLEDRITANNTFAGMLNYVPTRPESEILQEFAHTWAYLYEPSRFLARAYRFYLTMRPTRSALALQRGDVLPEVSPPAKLSLRKHRQQLHAFFCLIWWQGIRPPYRLQFWRQLWGILRRNPSRAMSYLKACALGENMLRLTDEIEKSIQSAQDLSSRSNFSAESDLSAPREMTSGARMFYK